MRTVALQDILGATPEMEDRRLHKRLRVRRTIRVRSLDGASEEETAMMIDVSRDGVYFKVRSDRYRVGMDIQLTFPTAGFQCVCNIVRIEHLPNNMVGVGGLIVSW
jgi:PilZ domain